MALKIRGVRPHGNRIQVNVRRSGKLITFSVLKKPTQTNLLWASRHLDELIDEHLSPGKSTTVVESLDLVSETYLLNSDLADSTRMSYADSLDIYWLPAIGTRDPLTLTYAILLGIDQGIKWPSPKTRKNAVSALRGVLAYAYRKAGLPVSTSPAHQLELGKHQKPVPNPFTKDERAKIVNWMDAKSGDIGLYFKLAFATGMRSGELIALRPADYDGETLFVHHSRVRGIEKASTKTYESRHVSVPSWLRNELDLRVSRVTDPAIILTQHKKPYQTATKLNNVFRQCLEELGIRPRTGPYPWRHTFACIGITDGIDPGYLSRQLGHNLETFFRTYARWIDGQSDSVQQSKVDLTWD